METKIFDPQDSPSGAEVLDPTLVQRDGQWWMYLAGQAGGFGATQLFSASLPPGAPLAASGWRLTEDASGHPVPLCGNGASAAWDGTGGRHCPAYVKGWCPHRRQWVERIYYAGAAEHLWGPYTIGFLEWDGAAWIDQKEPAFAASEDWERGSVYEPNLLYHDGTWKLWYVAGSNGDDYLVHGYAESEDGVAWGKHSIFAPAGWKLFDFCVREIGGAYEAVFARVWVAKGEAPADTGLWWCRAEQPYASLEQWGKPVQIMDARDRGWHSGPWKPSLQVHPSDRNRRLVFFDGSYRTDEPGPFPFAFTTGCLEFRVPDA